MYVDAGDRFDGSIRAFAWTPTEGRTAIDATVFVEARRSAADEDVVLIIHGRLERTNEDGEFTVPLDDDTLAAMLAHGVARSTEAGTPEVRSVRIADARFLVDRCPIPETHAPTDTAGSSAIEDCFGLVRESWMQDWPLEVADASRLDEFCEAYERLDDDASRFDVMQLALYAWNEHPRPDEHAAWFGRTLLRDFAIHAHTIAYWSDLDRGADDPEFASASPEYVFAISGRLRGVWEAALVPVAAELANA